MTADVIIMVQVSDVCGLSVPHVVSQPWHLCDHVWGDVQAQ